MPINASTNNFVVILSLLGLVLLFSCSKKFTGFTTRMEPKLEIRTFTFDYLNSKARIKYEGPDQKEISGQATIRIKKDSIIWMSISPGLGVEVGRGVITQDSLHFINRLDKVAYSYDYVELSKKFNFDLNYALVQAVLIGNMPFTKSGEDQVMAQESGHVISQKEGKILVENFISNSSQKLTHLKMTDLPEENSMDVYYTNFQWVNDIIFPHSNQIRVQYVKQDTLKTTAIDVEFNRVEISDKPLRFPFSIPSKYARL